MLARSMTGDLRLHPLRAGELLVPPELLARASGPLATPRAIGFGFPRKRFVWIPVPAFLIEHPTEGPVVIDTGMPAITAQDARAGLGWIGNLLYDVRMTRADGIGAQLRARGVDPDDVRTVVMTHLHMDHAAGMRELPNAVFAADGREWKAADSRAGFVNGYHRPHFEGAARRTLETGSAPPWEGFDHALDLLGDGSVRILSTPGHTPGHQSVSVALSGRRALITADVAYTRAAVFGDAEPGLRWNAKVLRRSLAQVRRHVAEHPDTVVIPGHDPEAWAGLDAVYT
jgi:glyoxylase-like metal-dependent hydrolase (beta-lactamase superfamily II)